MRYCPYCGAGFSDSTVSLCMDCGKKKPVVKEATQDAKEKPNDITRWKKKKREQEESPAVAEEANDESYDGYYNDVLPPDIDRVKDGIDKELIKKIATLCIGVAVIILMCVALLFFL